MLNLTSMMLLLFIVILSYCSAYEDSFPDPDFVTKSAENIPNMNQELEGVCIEQSQKLPGYFKLILKEILKKHILSDEEEAMFRNADFVDPQSLSEIVLNLIPNKPYTHTFEDITPKTLFHLVSELPKHLEFVIGYILIMFVLCYFSRRCRSFILTLHSLLLYLGAIYSKINKQYAEIKGKKMAAITTMPNHCKEGFSVLSLISMVWSKFQIGDQCKRYQQEVMSEPFYEIEYLKCLFYPLVSIFSVPLTVLGEELGPFLENILTPFPFHLQIFILIFVSTIMGVLVTVLCKVKSYAPYVHSVNDTDKGQQKLLEELQGMRNELKTLQMTRYSAEITDIMVLNNHEPPNEIDGNLTIDESRTSEII